MKSVLMFVLVVMCGLSAQAIEVDNFTGKFSPLDDATEILNKESNLLFDKALLKANAKGACNQKALYKELRKKFRNFIMGEFNVWMEHSPDVPRQETHVSQSIYADVTGADAIVLGLIQNRMFDTKLGSVVRVGDYRAGTDKFEHFSGTGFSYFRKYYLQGISLDKIVAKGLASEEGIMGENTTGVLSYGDLSANFNGMRFWNRILGTGHDILGAEYDRTPYVRCENEQWVRQADVDWSEYVDLTWDESENCSHFRTNRIKNRVWRRIHQLERDLGKDLSCDQSGEVQRLANTKYKAVKDWLFPK